MFPLDGKLGVEEIHRAPITPARAVSCDTVGDGGSGALLGNATGALFPVFWRFVSDAILRQGLNEGGSMSAVVAGLSRSKEVASWWIKARQAIGTEQPTTLQSGQANERNDRSNK